MEVLASVEKKMGDQAEGTGSEPVLEAAETMLGEQAMGIGAVSYTHLTLPTKRIV